VEQTGVANLAHLIFRERDATIRSRAVAVDAFGEPRRECRHAERVARRRGVARFDRRDRRRDEALEESLDVLVQMRVLDRHRRLRRERRHEIGRALIERHDLRRHDVSRAQRDGEVALPVDQLHDANHLILQRIHRNHEHRLRPIPELLVERTVLPVRDMFGEQVHVIDQQRFAGRGHVARDARVIHRHGELAEREIGERGVLRELEAERFRVAIRIGLHEVQRSRIRIREATGLREDHPEQRVEILLGGERGPDAGEFAQVDGAGLLQPIGARGDHRRG